MIAKAVAQSRNWERTVNALTGPIVGPLEVHHGPLPVGWQNYVVNLPPPADVPPLVPVSAEDDLNNHLDVIKTVLIGSTPLVQFFQQFFYKQY